MDPLNYSAAFDVPNPLQAFTTSMQAGAGIRDLQIKQQQQDQALAMQQQMNADLLALSRDPSPQNVAALSVRYPQLSEQFKRSYDMLTAEQQQARLSSSIPVYAAVQSGRPDIAAAKLRETADAYDNSGRKQEAAQTRAMADLVEQHPEQAKLTTGLLLASVMGADKFGATFGQIGAEARATEDQPTKVAAAEAEATIKRAVAAVAPQKARQDLEKGVWDVANVRSQISERAARLGLDRDKLTSEMQVKLSELQQKFGQLPDDARKLVNEGAIQAAASEQSVAQLNNLAGKLEQEGAAGKGVISNVSEWLKTATGNQDALTGLRQEYTRLMSQGVLKLLPPGPASDKDIQLAREGFPKSTADAAYLASFLRGMAKMSAYDAALSNAKSEWAGAVQHLGRTKTDIEIDGVKVPAGTTFNEFSRKYMAQKAEDLNSAATVKSRGYMRFAE